MQIREQNACTVISIGLDKYNMLSGHGHAVTLNEVWT